MKSLRRGASNTRTPAARLARLLLIGICALVTASCDMEKLAESFVPEVEADYAKQHIALYRTGEVDEIMSQLHPTLANDETLAAIEQMVALVPDEDPRDIVVVGSRWTSTSDASHVTLTFQYEFENLFLIAGVVVERVADGMTINTINFQPLEASLQDTHRFTPSGQGPLGFVFLVLAVAIPVFVVVSFVYFLRTPIPRRKWLWGLFILLGVGTLRINWTTGEVSHAMLSWLLLGAGFGKQLYGPLILSISAPIGAITFWMRRHEWLEEPETADD